MVLKIDSTFFDMAFHRDIEYHRPYDGAWYLDLKTGDVSWVYHEDHYAESDGFSAEDNKVLREEVESKPDEFAEIPGLHHGGHHDILKSFINSDWTADESLREKVLSCYQDSIGRWKENVGKLDESRTILDRWYEYQERPKEGMIDDFFKQLNVEYEFY